MTKCSNCGVEVDEGAKFCGECGTPVPQVKECPQCHAEWPVKAKLCGDCGYNFATGSMSAAGAALMGNGNMFAGDIVNNVNVSNSGNVSNVVTNTIVTNVVNNVTSGDVSEGAASQSGNRTNRKLVVIFDGEAMVCGYTRYDSFQEMLAVPGLERKRLSYPKNCASMFAGYVLDECKIVVVEETEDGSKVEHKIDVDSSDFYDDEPPVELMITADTEKEFDFGPNGSASYLLTFDRKRKMRYVGTIDLDADFNPMAFKIEGRKNIWSNFHLATRITYAGQEVRLTPEGSVADESRKLVAWMRDEYWDLDADSVEDAWLADITVEGVNIQFARKVFESGEDLAMAKRRDYEEDFLEYSDDLFDDRDNCFLVGKTRVTIVDRFGGGTQSLEVDEKYDEIGVEKAQRYFDAPDYAAGEVELYMRAERHGVKKYSEICYGAFGLSHIRFGCSKIECENGEVHYCLTLPMLDGESIESAEDDFGEAGEVVAWTVSSHGITKFLCPCSANDTKTNMASVSAKEERYIVRYSGKAIRAEVKSFESLQALNSANLPSLTREGYGEADCVDCTWRMLLEGAQVEVTDPSGKIIWSGDPSELVEIDKDAELLSCAAASGDAVNLFMVRIFDDGLVATLPTEDGFSIADLKFRVGEGSYREFTHNMLLEERKIRFVTGVYFKGERIDFDFFSDSVDPAEGPDKKAKALSSWAEVAPNSTGYIKPHYINAWIENDLRSVVEKAKKLLTAPAGSYDISKGARLMRVAADRGDPEAQMLYADLIVAKKGISAPAIIASGYYEKAIAGGEKMANFKLACLYEEGETNGLAKYFRNCPDLAREYFLAAKNAGISEAFSRI